MYGVCTTVCDQEVRPKCPRSGTNAHHPSTHPIPPVFQCRSAAVFVMPFLSDSGSPASLTGGKRRPACSTKDRPNYQRGSLSLVEVGVDELEWVLRDAAERQRDGGPKG